MSLAHMSILTHFNHLNKKSKQKIDFEREINPVILHPDPSGPIPVRGTGLEVLEGAIGWASSARSAALGILGVRASKPWRGELPKRGNIYL